MSRFFKGPQGWVGRTDLALDATYMLRFETYSPNKGYLQTTVTRYTWNKQTSFTYVPVAGYSKIVVSASGVRLTQQAVRSQHLAVLEQTDAIVEQVKCTLAMLPVLGQIIAYIESHPRWWEQLETKTHQVLGQWHLRAKGAMGVDEARRSLADFVAHVDAGLITRNGNELSQLYDLAQDYKDISFDFNLDVTITSGTCFGAPAVREAAFADYNHGMAAS